MEEFSRNWSGIAAYAIAGLEMALPGKRVEPTERRDVLINYPHTDPLLISLTLANLRGVPYPITFGGETGFSHPMRVHADVFSFGSSTSGGADLERLPPGAFALPPDRRDGNWGLLQTAALATGAFPGALKHRHLSRPRGDYDFRVARAVGNGALGSAMRSSQPRSTRGSSATASGLPANADGLW